MKIQFINTSDVDIEKPVPASKVIPDWYKHLESYSNKGKRPDNAGKTTVSAKRCMPLFDAIVSGYLVTSVSDVYIKQVDGQPYYSWGALEQIEFHSPEQLPVHPQNKNHQIAIPKWNNYWGIKTPKGYSCLIVNPMHRDLPFTIFPGVVDTDTYYAPIKFPFTLNDAGYEGLIPAGTPIAQIIPFKRDDWKIELGSNKDLKQIKTIYYKLSSKFFDAYKIFFRQPKEYK